MNDEEVNFEEAVRKFQQFLIANQYSAQIEWVQLDDVLLTGRKLMFVRLSSPVAREKTARQIYEESIRRRYGVLLATICDLQSATCCYIWTPRTSKEAEWSLMPVGLKMSAKTDKVKSIGVNNRFWRTYLRIRYKGKQALKRELFRG